MEENNGVVEAIDSSEATTDVNAILKKHNSSIEIIIGKLLPGLDATRDIKDRDGEVVATVEDWTARAKIGTLILTAAGLMKTTSVDLSVGTTVLTEGQKSIRQIFRECEGVK